MGERPDDVVEAAACSTEWQAESLAAALRARGVHAQVIGGLTAGFRAEAPSRAKVVVLRGEQEQAKRLLADLQVESVSIDWEGVDVGPADESTPAGGTARWRPSAGVLVAMALLAAAAAWTVWRLMGRR